MVSLPVRIGDWLTLSFYHAYVRSGQVDHKRGAVVLLTDDLDGAPVIVNDAVGGSETKSGAAGSLLGGEEGFRKYDVESLHSFRFPYR